jgi:hypothetical protein
MEGFIVELSSLPSSAEVSAPTAKSMRLKSFRSSNTANLHSAIGIVNTWVE